MTFAQLIVWTDCNNDCSFCSQRLTRDNLDTNSRKSRLMKTAKWITDVEGEYDRIGLIGGELFCYDGLNIEWNCVADSFNTSSAGSVFLTSNLIGKMDNLLRFLDICDKHTVVCTSYDTVGRFTEETKERWYENLNTLNDMGIPLCCTSIMTDEFIHDDPKIPKEVYVNLQEPILSCEWYYDNPIPDNYNRSINEGMNLNLMKRSDFLKWALRNEDYIRNYHDYANTHSDELFGFVNGEITKRYHNRMNLHLAQCGHQYSARCYSDSDRCIQCDVENLL